MSLFADQNHKTSLLSAKYMWSYGRNCFVHLPALLSNLTDVEEDQVLSAGCGWWTEGGRMVEFQIWFGHAV